MRLHEFTNTTQVTQLDELNLRTALATGAMAAATALSPGPRNDTVQTPTVAANTTKAAATEPTTEQMIDIVVNKYKIDPALARHIVKLAKKHERPVFPKAADILAVIGIESSFNPHAVSGLRRDPAVGLTQVRPRVWGLDPKTLRGNLEAQVTAGAQILDMYHQKLRNTEQALHAYNMGITALRQGRTNPRYVKKFKDERSLYI